jgi:hemerythrin superfamily protein
MADDVITLITPDHRKAEELFARLTTGKGDRRAIVAELHALLTAHTRAEEDVVYPGLDAHDGLKQHKQAEILLRTRTDVIDEAFLQDGWHGGEATSSA